MTKNKLNSNVTTLDLNNYSSSFNRSELTDFESDLTKIWLGDYKYKNFKKVKLSLLTSLVNGLMVIRKLFGSAFDGV